VKAAAALGAVNGTAGTSGSVADRRRAWTQLLDATNGADPTRPLPQPSTPTGTTGTTGLAGVAGITWVPAVPVTMAGPMPLASPGVIPPVPARVLRRPGGCDRA
jgi:hypothetical protein